MLRVTGAVNVVEQRDPPRSPSPLWELSFGRKCRTRNLIGCNGDHVMLQCEKLMSLRLVERKEVLEKSGLCIRVQRFLKLKKSPASVARKSSVLILKNIFNFL